MTDFPVLMASSPSFTQTQMTSSGLHCWRKPTLNFMVHMSHWRGGQHARRWLTSPEEYLRWSSLVRLDQLTSNSSPHWWEPTPRDHSTVVQYNLILWFMKQRLVWVWSRVTRTPSPRYPSHIITLNISIIIRLREPDSEVGRLKSWWGWGTPGAGEQSGEEAGVMGPGSGRCWGRGRGGGLDCTLTMMESGGWECRTSINILIRLVTLVNSLVCERALGLIFWWL